MIEILEIMESSSTSSSSSSDDDDDLGLSRSKLGSRRSSSSLCLVFRSSSSHSRSCDGDDASASDDDDSKVAVDGGLSRSNLGSCPLIRIFGIEYDGSIRIGGNIGGGNNANDKDIVNSFDSNGGNSFDCGTDDDADDGVRLSLSKLGSRLSSSSS